MKKINFNFSHSNEYVLNIDLIDEFIHLYGIETRLLITEKKNIDVSVFGDWSSIKTNNENIFDIHLYPENADSFEKGGYEFNDFGFNSFDSFNGFISSIEASKYNLTIKKLLGSLVVLPSNKVLEITNVEHQNPSINNLWSYSDQKSCFKLSLRTYEFKLHDEIEKGSNINSLEVEDTEEDISFDSLDGYFETLLKEKEKIEYEAETKPNKEEAIVNNDERDPFGW